MGMYTGLRCNLIIKEKYKNFIENIDNGKYEWSAIESKNIVELSDESLKFISEEHYTIKEFSKYSRSMMIPKGGLLYMPNIWEEDGFSDSFDREKGIWNFQCSLKNYEGEIQYFINNIIPIISESGNHIEVYCEQWSCSKFYELIDGKIYRNKDKDIVYKYETPDWVDEWYN